MVDSGGEAGEAGSAGELRMPAWAVMLVSAVRPVSAERDRRHCR